VTSFTSAWAPPGLKSNRGLISPSSTPVEANWYFHKMFKLINGYLTKFRLKRSLKELALGKVKPLEQVIAEIKRQA